MIIHEVKLIGLESCVFLLPVFKWNPWSLPLVHLWGVGFSLFNQLESIGRGYGTGSHDGLVAKA